MRKNLVLLKNSTESEYQDALSAVESFQEWYPETKIGFSANAGEFGGFVTDDIDTYKIWNKSPRKCRNCRNCGIAYPLTHRYALTCEVTGKWFHSKSCRDDYLARTAKDREWERKAHEILAKNGLVYSDEKGVYEIKPIETRLTF